MVNREDILTYLRTNKYRMASEYHLTKIGLFGSHARDKPNQDSDIDVVVEFEPGTENLYGLKARLRSELQSVFHQHIDLCRLKYMNPVILHQIEAETQYA